MISIKNLTKTFDGFPALTDLSLCVQKGSIYGLVGINGAGKTTIINLLAGIYRPDAGEITFDGEGIYDNAALKSRIGLIPDELWFPSCSIEALARTCRKIYSGWDEEKFQKLTDIFRLDKKKNLRSLSKGMKKQAAFALILSTGPDWLLLDEPIDGLDPIARKAVWNAIVDDVAMRQMTVLVSSHNLREMETICDAVGILSRGTMKLERELDDMKSSLHKIQLAFENKDSFQRLEGRLPALHKTESGSLQFWIVKGNAAEIREIISRENPKIMDILPLTLEEIFIYELGGDDDEIKEILI